MASGRAGIEAGNGKGKRLFGLALWAVAVVFPLGVQAEEGRQSPPVIVTTFTILEDLTAQVAGPEADVRGLTPVGAEVHEWELNAENFIDLETADVVFYNGHGLEQWLNQMRQAVGAEARLVPVAEEIDRPVIAIRQGEFEGVPDPHAWMDPAAAQQYVAVIRDVLSELDPDRADTYAANAGMQIKAIEDARREADELMGCIPQDGRVLITSEAAFLYFADAFAFEHTGIWGSNAEVEGSPEQMMRIIDLIAERQPAALFWESTISERHVRSVSDDTGVPVAGPLYVDSLGAAGSGAESYVDLIRANARLLREGLGRDCED